MVSVAVVASYEDGAVGDNFVDIASGVLLGAVVGFVGVEAVGVIVVVNCEGAVFYDYSFAWESYDALDNELVAVACDEIGVAKDDDLATLGDVLSAKEMGPADWEAIDNDPVLGVEGFLHAASYDVVGAKNERGENEGYKNNASYE